MDELEDRLLTLESVFLQKEKRYLKLSGPLVDICICGLCPFLSRSFLNIFLNPTCIARAITNWCID
jgi:hypothetical protein